MQYRRIVSLKLTINVAANYRGDSIDGLIFGAIANDSVADTRKRYALLQTPEFVEEFILDRTLTPAIREFGYREVRMIDPTCGSGHFLLGGFQRVVNEWSRAEPSRNRRDIAQKALNAVAGVDLNPFAVAISRFRLLVAALLVSEVHRLSDSPDFDIHVAIGDSLLHGQRFGLSGQSGVRSDELFDAAHSHLGTGLAHAYASEDLAEVQRILSRQYHAVVGNHFILDRGGNVFNRTAPVIKLSANASEEEYLGRVGLLNSSVACFWMKQVSHQKQMMGGDGIRISDKSKVPYQFASTRLRELPLPPEWQKHQLYPRLVELTRMAEKLARKTIEPSSSDVIQRGLDNKTPIEIAWKEIEVLRIAARSQLVLIQEEIDFVCYHLYGLTTDIRVLSASTDWSDVIDAGCRIT